MRSHYTNQLDCINTIVTVAGFIDTKRDHGGLMFVMLRDYAGLIQCVFQTYNQEHNLPARESVLSITGKVVARSPETVNPDLPNGHIEIVVLDFTVHSISSNLPFDNHQEISDECKLKYRYLYLRRQQMQQMLRTRAEMLTYMHTAMQARGFLQVQTPILTASSPEGARDYVVPSYEHKGKFYALPQAPQQFKQILMASGVDKYYSIAPCFRAENSRADRSPGEFYQLDLEMSFATQSDVTTVVQEVVGGLFEHFGKQISFDTMTYDDAMYKYGCDKPDLRNPLTLQDATQDIQANPPTILQTLANQSGFVAKILAVETAVQFTRKQLDDLQLHAKQFGLQGIAYAKFDGQQYTGPGAKMIPSAHLTLDKSGFVFLIAGLYDQVHKLAASLRNHVYFTLLEVVVHPDEYKFCWITDFPMYELDDGKIAFTHNPFSMPIGGMHALQTQDPLTIKAYQYDLVCNGVEVCSGSVRNHDANALIKAFEIAGYDPDKTIANFPAVLAAFRAGVPPHAGAAPGVDRLLMLLLKQENIREVIAFPLSQNGQDLLMGAPRELEATTLRDLGLSIVKA